VEAYALVIAGTLRTIAIGVHVGRIITNAQADEGQWRQYVLARPPLIVEFKRLSGAELAKLKKFPKEIEAWEKGARMVRPADHLKS
jgi:hypothetical protein